MLVVVRLKRVVAVLLAIAAATVVLLEKGGDARAVSKMQGLCLPVVMYHHVLREQSRLGDYVISPDELEQDLIWLREHGYQTVLPTQVLAWEEGRGELPEKPIMLTFDDGFLACYAYVLPLLEEYDCSAAFSIVGSYADRYTTQPDTRLNYAAMDWDTVCEMLKSGHAEIISHSYDMHRTSPRNGCARMAGESRKKYVQVLYQDLYTMQQRALEMTGQAPIALAYPFGERSDGAKEVVQQLGIQMTFTCFEKMNLLSHKQGELYDLGRINRPSGMTSAAFFIQIQ